MTSSGPVASSMSRSFSTRSASAPLSSASRASSSPEAGESAPLSAFWTSVICQSAMSPPCRCRGSGATRRGRAGTRRSGLEVSLVTCGERAAGGLHVGGAHEGLPDQHGVDADAVEVVELLARGEARLGHHRLARGDVREQFVGALDVDAEVAEVAVVEAEDVRVDVERALELLLVMDLDEHVEVEAARLLVQLVEVVVLERGDDQQDGVRAGGGRFVELIRVDDEVLAQHGQLRGGDHLAQVVEAAAEVRALRQDG